MNYDKKLEIANNYLSEVAGVTWELLSDINSLHHAETEDDIKMLCDERLLEDNFPLKEIIENKLKTNK
jgi:hypothetical protein